MSQNVKDFDKPLLETDQEATGSSEEIQTVCG